MDLDPVLLARAQFAFTIAFHIIFPSFTIGLSAYIATLEVLWEMRATRRVGFQPSRSFIDMMTFALPPVQPTMPRTSL